VRHLQQTPIIVMSRDDLQADRQAFRGVAARNRNRRIRGD